MSQSPRPSTSRASAARGHAELTVFGRRAVMEAVSSEHVEVHDVHAARSLPPTFRRSLQHACRERDVSLSLVHPREVGERSGQPRHDQGVAARIRLLHVSPIEHLVDATRGPGARRPLRALALDGVTNPLNIGMIVRSAVAAGTHALLWPTHGCPWIDGLVVKASASVVYRCPIVVCPTLPEALDELGAAGFTRHGLAAGASTDLYDLRPAHRSVFVVGSEAQGLSAEVDARLDARVSIPMAGGVESLNVAVAASLVCFHLARGGG